MSSNGYEFNYFLKHITFSAVLVYDVDFELFLDNLQRRNLSRKIFYLRNVNQFTDFRNHPCVSLSWETKMGA